MVSCPRLLVSEPTFKSSHLSHSQKRDLERNNIFFIIVVIEDDDNNNRDPGLLLLKALHLVCVCRYLLASP